MDTKEAELRSDEARLSIGGNQPPSPMTPLEVTRFLADSEATLLSRRDELLAGVARFKKAHPVIEDDEMQGRAGDFGKQIQAAIKISKDSFALSKKPFIEGGRAVDQFFRAITEPLERGLQEVRAPMTAYAVKKEAVERAERERAAAAARAEADRVQRELAAQYAAEQETRAAAAAPETTVEEAIVASQQADATAKAATAKAADLTRSRGDAGSVSSLREHWDVELVDLSKVPLEFLTFDLAKARRAVAGGKLREIAGCRVFVTKHVHTR